MRKAQHQKLLHIHPAKDAACAFIHHKHQREDFIAPHGDLIFFEAVLMANDLFIPLWGGENLGAGMLDFTDIQSNFGKPSEPFGCDLYLVREK